MDDSHPAKTSHISTDDEKLEKHVDDQTQDVPIASQKDAEILPEFNHADERALVRKLDKYIIPPTMLLYLVSFLDRVNIGNARLYGLEEDLGLEGSQFQLAVSILFVTYVLLEVPCNLLIKKLRPSRFISFICVGWGTC